MGKTIQQKVKEAAKFNYAGSSPINDDDDDDNDVVETEEHRHINQIRKLIREQSNCHKATKSNGVVVYDSDDSSDEMEVSIRKFTPLPDIPRSDDTYYRTESSLVKTSVAPALDRDNSFIDGKNCLKFSFPVEDNSFVQTCLSRKETRYHFGGSSQTKKPYNHKLPSLEKAINHTIQNTMDLDEDLPMNPEFDRQNQRQIYTSPGDRIISPIKRPQAPSPPNTATAHRLNSKQKTSSDSDSDADVILL